MQHPSVKLISLWQFSLILLSVGLLGCSPQASEKQPASPVVAASSPAPREPLSVLYRKASDCLSECLTKWHKSMPSGTSREFDFEPKAPKSFVELLMEPERMLKFSEMVEQLPEQLQSIGKLGPSDEPEVVTSKFGNYTKEKPTLSGSFITVISNKQQLAYVYSNVYYQRLNRIPGSLHVAFDPETGEFVGVLRGGERLDEYYLIGANSLLMSTLVAYTVAEDLETANMLAHYTKKDAGDYESQPVLFPLSLALESAIERVQLLNDLIGEKLEARGVPAPSKLQEANAERAASAWYGVSQGRESCIESPMSPADRIDLIKSAGVSPRIRESNTDGRLSAVEVTAVNGGYESTWKFFKSKSECERTLVVDRTPNKYR